MEKGEIAGADVKDMLPDARLQAINASLAKDPWRGLIVICPYTPVPAGRSAESARGFGRFVVESLLPRVGELRGAPLSRDRTGIDGQTTRVLDVTLPMVTVPLNPGKNLTVICEVVAMNHLLRYSGVDTARAFNDRLIKRLTDRRQLQEYLEEDNE
jgi:hypothetical protein